MPYANLLDQPKNLECFLPNSTLLGVYWHHYSLVFLFLSFSLTLAILPPDSHAQKHLNGGTFSPLLSSSRCLSSHDQTLLRKKSKYSAPPPCLFPCVCMGVLPSQHILINTSSFLKPAGQLLSLGTLTTSEMSNAMSLSVPTS